MDYSNINQIIELADKDKLNNLKQLFPKFKNIFSVYKDLGDTKDIEIDDEKYEACIEHLKATINSIRMLILKLHKSIRRKIKISNSLKIINALIIIFSSLLSGLGLLKNMSHISIWINCVSSIIILCSEQITQSFTGYKLTPSDGYAKIEELRDRIDRINIQVNYGNPNIKLSNAEINDLYLNANELSLDYLKLLNK